MSALTPCPEPDVVVAFLSGDLTAAEEAAFELHIDGCADCCALMAAAARSPIAPTPRMPDPALETTAGGATWSSSDEVSSLVTGEVVGRYVVTGMLGSGAMGVVHAARDEELDRAVALKLLRRADGADGKTRLLREARALARLSHPNVVKVYDIGTHLERVWVAMELVHGDTLDQWSSAQPRNWRRVVGVLAQAARGLAAAHQCGLVHRDFKPTNVMVGPGDHVTVLDFGLARSLLSKSAERSVPSDRSLDGDEETDLTRTGSIVGTPIYMSPEQHAGRPTDARSDQYAFCVTAFEALHGERPFPARTLAALGHLKQEGRIAAVPATSSVPKWLHAVITRGLHPLPEARWPSMDALLRALEQGGRPRVHGWLAAAGLVGGIALVGSWWRPDAHAACRGSRGDLASVWNDDRARAIADAFAATDLPHAPQAFASLRKTIDDHVDAWMRVRATHCADAPSPSTDRVLLCLDRRRVELRALLDVLEHADETTVDAAPLAVASMSDPARCSSPERASAPPAPAIAAAVTSIREQLATATALYAAGRAKEALDIAGPLLAQAEQLGYEPLWADVALHVGEALSELGEHDEASALLTDVVTRAEAAGHEETAFEAAIHLVFLFGVRQHEVSECEHWSRHASALEARIDAGPLLRARRLEYVGGCLRSGQRFDEALEAFGEAVELRLRDDDTNPVAATTLDNLGTLLSSMGRLDEALERHRRALSIAQGALGEEHPNVSRIHANMAAVLVRLGRAHDAIVHAEAAHAGLVARLGEHAPDAATTLAVLASVHYGAGDPTKAIALSRRVLEIRRQVLGDEHPHVANTLINLGGLLGEAGEAEEARAMLLEAAANLERGQIPRRALLGTVHQNLGTLELVRGDRDGAERHFTQALELLELEHGPDHPDIAYPASRLGKLRLEDGDAAAAVTWLERAHAIRNAHAIVGASRAEELFDFARALHATAGSGDRPIELARRARAQLEGDTQADLRAEIDRWLDEQAEP